MPITDIIDVTEGAEMLSEHHAAIVKALVEHARETRALRAVRARKAKEWRRVLTPGVRFELDPLDDPRELADKAATRILDTITTDADGEAWRGTVELLGDPDATGKPVVVETVDVKLTAGSPQPKSTKDDEFVAVLKELRSTIGGLGEVVVKIGHMKADEVGAYTQMVRDVADAVRKQADSHNKWTYKMEREKQETAREEAAERGQTERTASRWGALETFAEEWKDVAGIFADFAVGNRKAPPDRPTDAELAKVFDAPGMTVDGRAWSEIFDPIRAIVARMLAEPNMKVRIELARKELKAAIGNLSKAEGEAMQLRMVMMLGPERTREVAAWLKAPLT